MCIENFQVLNVRKLSYEISGLNLERNLLIDKDKNAECAAEGR
jgi:hypothetical protein